MTEAIFPYINYLATYSLILSVILIIKDREKVSGAFAITGFIGCVLFYLIIDLVNNPILKGILLLGPFLLPFSFWLVARTLFNDDPIPFNRLLIYLLSTTLVYYGLYLLAGFTQWDKMTAIAGRTFSLFFIVLAIIEAQSGKRTDLDEDRIRLRKYFTYFIGLVVLITILSELGLARDEQEWPRLVQRSTILLFNTLFIAMNVSIKSRLFDARKKGEDIQHPQIIEKIQSAMVDQQLYRKEKLTIGQLAEVIGEQEYRVRRVINQEMGYRNFIDFINAYRIKEATGLLKNQTHSDLTVLEIAYKTGFNSIGPFNRAFKQATGLTPTDYRKKNQGN